MIHPSKYNTQSFTLIKKETFFCLFFIFLGMWALLPSSLGNECFGYLAGPDLQSARVSTTWAKFRAVSAVTTTSELHMCLLSSVRKVEVNNVPRVDWALVSQCKKLITFDFRACLYWARSLDITNGAFDGKHLREISLRLENLTEHIAEFLLGFASSLETLKLELTSDRNLELLNPLMSRLNCLDLRGHFWLRHQLVGLHKIRELCFSCCFTDTFLSDFASTEVKHLVLDRMLTTYSKFVVSFLQRQTGLRTVKLYQDDDDERINVTLQELVTNASDFRKVEFSLDLIRGNSFQCPADLNLVGLRLYRLNDKLELLCANFHKIRNLDLIVDIDCNLSALSSLSDLDTLRLYLQGNDNYNYSDSDRRPLKFPWLLQTQRLAELELAGDDVETLYDLARRARVLFTEYGTVH